MAKFGYSGLGGLTLLVLLVAAYASPASGPSRRLLEDSVAGDPLLQLDDELWGPVQESRSDREKRLLNQKSSIGSGIGAKIGKSVASKAFSSVKQGVVKKVLSVSAMSSGSASGNGLKIAKTVGTKTAKAAAVIGIKTLLLNLIFGKINQLIEWKTKLLDNLEKQNRAKNQQFLTGGKPTVAPEAAVYAYTSSPAFYQETAQPVYQQPAAILPETTYGYSYSTPEQPYIGGQQYGK